MTWTYSSAPGTGSASALRDSVRFLVGDTDETDQQVSDEEIAFALSEVSSSVYRAGAIVARAIAAKYARLDDTTVDQTGLRANFSKRREAYVALAEKLDKQARTSSGLVGLPAAGGISVTEVDDANADDDRLAPVFEVDQFSGDHHGEYPDGAG